MDLGGAYIGPSQYRIIKLAEELEIQTYNVYFKGKNVLDLTTVSKQTSDYNCIINVYKALGTFISSQFFFYFSMEQFTIKE